MQKNIYISGTINGSYRAQNIIKILGDCGFKYWHLSGYSIANTIGFKPLRIILKIILHCFLLLIKIPLIFSSSHILVLPMNFSIITLLDVFIGRLLNKKIIIDYYIGIYDTYVNDRKEISANSRLAKFYQYKDRFLLNNATLVVFLNKAESIYYQRVAGVCLKDEKIKIIPLCIDYRKEMFIEKKAESKVFNICWWGTYIPLHGLEKLIDSFEYINDENIRLYIFGNSDKAAKPYQERITNLKLADYIVIKNDISFSNGLLGDFLVNHCDLAIGNFGDSEKAKTVLVNKLVDSISLGIPCLTQETLATKEFFEDGQAIKYCDATPEDIARMILKLKNNPEELDAVKKTAKDKYIKTFSPDVFKVKLLQALDL